MRSGLTESRPVSGTRSYRPLRTSGPWPTPTPTVRPPRQQRFVLVPHEGWLPLLLLAIAVYSVVYSVTAAITISHISILWATTALGLLAGLAVSKMRMLPQALLHLGACIIGYWLALFLTSSVAYHVSMLFLLSSLRSVFSSGLAFGGSAEGDMLFLFYLAFLCFFLGYFGSWLVYRAHLPWLVAMVYISILLVNLNYITKRDLSFLIVILVSALLLLIARVQLASQLAEWKSDGLHTDQQWLHSLSSRFLRVATLFVLLILPLSWMMPMLNQPAAGVTMWNELDNAWANLSHGQLPTLSNPSSLFNPYNPPSNFFSNELAITGSVNLPSGPVLSYTSSDTQGHYLESFAFDTFDGHQWTTQLSGLSRSYNANTQLPLDNNDASYTPLTTTIKVIQPPSGTRNFIFGPPVPGSFSVATTLFMDNNGTFVSSWTQSHPLTANETYEVSSEVVDAPVADLQQTALPSTNAALWTDDPNYLLLQQYYLQKPSDLSPEVLATARAWTSGATNAYSVAYDLEMHLSNPAVFTYSLDNGPVPANKDVITWLLQTHKGFCTYYATAMVIMARLLGLPARMINGFSQGHFDEQQNAWVVDGTDAHSWVQIYFPNYGWINFDPTPGFTLNNASSPSATATPKPSPSPASAPTAMPASTATAQAHQTGQHNQPSTHATSTDNLDKMNWLVNVSLLILLASLIVLGISVIRYRKQRALQSPVTLFYARLCRVTSLVGSPPELAQTPYEYTFLLSKRFPQLSGMLRRLADLVVRERWATAQQAPTPMEKQELIRGWPRLRNTILRSFFSRNR